MTARSTTALSFLTFGLLATTSFIQPSAAAVTEAQTGWAINRVASAASGSYCTMAQKYSDNSVVTLAKNQAGEYSLAFDFMKPVFTAKTSTVSLRPAGGSAQTFEIAPQSDKVAVVGLGKSESFISALKNSNKLDLETNGQTYTFNTKKFGEASAELSTCLASMKPAAPKEETAARTVSAPVEKMAATDPNTGRIADLQTENAQLRDALVETRKNYENSTANSPALNAELQEKVQLLQSENSQLKSSKVAAAPVAVATNNEDISKLKAELAAAQKQNESLQEQASQIMRQNQGGNNAASQQIAELTRANNELKAQLQAKAPVTQRVDQTALKENESLKQQTAQLQKQNADLVAQLQAKPAGAPVTQRVDQTAIRENEALKQQIAQLQQQSKSMPAVSPDDLKKISELQNENNALKQQLASAQQARVPANDSSIAKQLQVAQAENNALKKQLDEVQADSEKGLMKQAGNNWDLEQATRRYQESQREIRRLGSLLEKQQTEFKQKNAETEAMLFDPALTDKAQQAKLDELNAKIAQLEQQKPAPQDQAKIAQLEEQVKAGQAAQAQVSELQKQLAAAQGSQGQIAELQKQLAAAQSSQVKVAELQSQLQGAQNSQAQVAELQKQLTAAQASQAQVADLQKQLTAAQASQAQVAQLQQQLQSAQAAQAQVAQLQQQSQASQAQVAQLQQAAQASQAQVAQLQQQAQAGAVAQQQVAQLQQQAQAAAVAQQQVAQLQQQVQASALAQQRVAQLEHELQNARAVQAIAPAAGGPVQAAIPVALPVPQPSVAQAASNAMAAKVTPVVADSLAPKPAAGATITPALNIQFQSPDDFARMLQDVGINVRGGVQPVTGASTETYKAYRWKTDSLFGSAEQRAMKKGASFDKAVEDYLSRAEKRCGGDFAAIPADISSPLERAQAYEIACIGGKINTSASVLFTYGNDVMTTVAHEGKSDSMDLAMEARDRLAQKIGTVRTASR